MKAAVVEKPGTLVVRDIPEPSQLGEYDVLCRVEYGAVCTGTDTHIAFGGFAWPPVYPTILGHESIGRAVRVGAKVRNFKVGDVITRVGTPPPADGSLTVTWGGFAQLAIAKDHRAMCEDGLPESEWKSYRINQVVPPDIDPKSATMMITWRETLSYITRMGVKSGSRLLMIGSGGNALAFVAHAKNAGAAQIVVVGSPERREVFTQLGATHYLDYRNGPESLEQATKLAGDGFDFIIDGLGKSGLLNDYLPTVRDGGTIGMYGVDDFGKSLIEPMQARGEFRWYPNRYDEAETHDRVIAMIRNGQLDARHWLNLDSPFPLDRINDAFDQLKQRKLIKALIRVAE